jgi:hypothetical protein
MSTDNSPATEAAPLTLEEWQETLVNGVRCVRRVTSGLPGRAEPRSHPAGERE